MTNVPAEAEPNILPFPSPETPEARVRNVSRSRRGAVLRAIRRWEARRVEDETVAEGIAEAERTGNVRVKLRRPQRLAVGGRPDIPLPYRDEEKFAAGLFLTLRRFAVWIVAAFQFGLGNLRDLLMRRSSMQRRAVRLRRTFERAGATFIKLGQQLSIRMDLVPYVYARELEKLLDSVPPFPAEQAIAEIESSLGRKLSDIFAVFDPEPIGSASVACVYQAVLHDGTRVAVKVRRPRIGEQLSADMRALTWLTRALELVFLPPDFTKNFVFELRTMLLEELDFVQEARLTDLFRKRVRKAKLDWVTAPEVHFKYCSRTVITTSFVSGIWVTDLLHAVEQRDVVALQRLREDGIDPTRVARRYMQINRFGGFENLFFHADLHPANVLVQPNSELVLIDFGACGAFTQRELSSWRRLLDAQANEDVSGMVQAAIALLEPLPPIDVDEFRLRLEQVFWKDLYAIKSKHSPWWEHTSATIWISFAKLSREFRIPMNLNTLRMIRVSMLADTVAARLDHEIDPYAEYRRYERGAGLRTRKRLQKKLRRELGPRIFSRVEQVIETVTGAGYTLQRFVQGRPFLSFSQEVGKAAYGFKLLVDSLGALAFFTGSLVFVASIVEYFRGGGFTPMDLFFVVIKNGWYQFGVLFAGLFLARRLHHRLSRVDVRAERRQI